LLVRGLAAVHRSALALLLLVMRALAAFELIAPCPRRWRSGR
jgi:hypothetical protein